MIALSSGYPIWTYFASDFLLQSSTAGFALGLALLATGLTTRASARLSV